MTKLGFVNITKTQIMPTKILFVEDNIDLLSNITDYFSDKDWEIIPATRGLEAVNKINSNSFDLVVMDIGLPEIDGLTITKMMRKNGNTTPILHLSARKSINDRVVGLQAGADDYLIKPFSLLELEARIYALLRRSGFAKRRYVIGDLVINVDEQSVFRGEQEIKLSPTCFKILEELATNSPNIVERHVLERKLWGDNYVPNSDSLRSNIYQLRQALDKPFKTNLIHTHTGLGWSISDKH